MRRHILPIVDPPAPSSRSTIRLGTLRKRDEILRELEAAEHADDWERVATLRGQVQALQLQINKSGFDE